MLDYEALAEKIRGWLAGGVHPRHIARHLGISEKEVREFKRVRETAEPDAATIAARCAEIRASWSETDWRAACRLIR
jgi:hypothetical protein